MHRLSEYPSRAPFVVEPFVEATAAQVWRTQDIRPLPAGASAVHNHGAFQVSFLFR